MALEERKRDYLVKNTVFTLAQVNHLVHLFNSVASEPGNDNQSSSTAGENGATNLNPKGLIQYLIRNGFRFYPILF